MSGWLNPVKNRLLIVGNTSADYHVGAMFLRSAKDLGIDVRTCNTNIETYAPSMSSIFGKLFFKVAGKRPIESWKFNRNLTEEIHKFRPQIIIVTGIFPLQNIVFEAAHETGAKIVNYLTDSPWSRQNSNRRFTDNLQKYDYIFSTKKDLIPRLLEVKSRQVHFLPFAFDPFIHHCLNKNDIKTDNREIPDVCLIGSADRERRHFVSRFMSNFEGGLGLYGGFWNKDLKLKQYYGGIILGDAFCRTVHDTKINIGIVRRANSDGHSMRTYEIPACGGVGIYEDTTEHREIFSGYPEYGFFSSPEDLADKCQWLLEHFVEREEMRKLGIQIIVNDSNTYTSRLKTILEMCKG